MLGIPTVTDRLIQQAIAQKLNLLYDGSFSESSFGFRPGRSAHQAVGRALEYFENGKRKVVEMDLEKFFDRVNHDKLMSILRERITDKPLLKLIEAIPASRYNGGRSGQSAHGGHSARQPVKSHTLQHPA
ncbi:MAG: reverse transcriptase domain-containing protein [Bacteroides thetaiotaomicron]